MTPDIEFDRVKADLSRWVESEYRRHAKLERYWPYTVADLFLTGSSMLIFVTTLLLTAGIGGAIAYIYTSSVVVGVVAGMMACPVGFAIASCFTPFHLPSAFDNRQQAPLDLLASFNQKYPRETEDRTIAIYLLVNEYDPLDLPHYSDMLKRSVGSEWREGQRERFLGKLTKSRVEGA